MTRPASDDDHARRDVARLLATWGVEEDPATAEIVAALDASRRERARRAVAAAPPPIPPAVPKKVAPKRVAAPSPAPKPKRAAAPPPAPTPAPTPVSAPAPVPKVRKEPAPKVAPPTPAPVAPKASAPKAAAPIPVSEAPKAPVPKAAPSRARTAPAPRRRRPAPLRAWLFLLAPVLLAGFVLAALAWWNSGTATGDLLVSLEHESPRAMELLLVSPGGSSSEAASFAKGTQQLQLRLPHGSYELYLDGRYTGIQISVPKQTQTVLLIPPERGANPRRGESKAMQREPRRETRGE